MNIPAKIGDALNISEIVSVRCNNFLNHNHSRMRSILNSAKLQHNSPWLWGRINGITTIQVPRDTKNIVVNTLRGYGYDAW